MISAPPRPRPRRSHRLHGASGYTLVEMLVVLALIGMLLGVAALAANPDPQARLQRDGERLSSLFALAADEAQMRAKPLRWEADETGYRFLIADGRGWKPLADDEHFKARTWDAGRVNLALESRAGAADVPGVAVDFPRNGLQPAFSLLLSAEAARLRLRGDGRGTYAIANDVGNGIDDGAH